MDGNCLGGAGLDAIAAPDTLGVRRVFADVHIHFADTAAFSAGDTFVLVHFVAKQGKPVKQGIERPERTHPFAKRPIKQHAQHDHPGKNQKFPPEEGTKGRPNTAACKRQGDAAFQDSLGANVLAEVGRGDPRLICEPQRQGNDGNQENAVLDPAQEFQLLCAEFLRWDSVKKVLQPAKGAEKAADEPAEHNPEENQNSRYVIREVEF